MVITEKIHFNHKAAVILALAAGTAAVLTAGRAAAYWTDVKELHSKVSAMNVGISYDSEGLGMDDGYFMPGDSRDFCFTVKNTGDISVDIRPVITVTSSNDMKLAGSCFIITDKGGNEPADYEKTYLDAEGNTVTAENAAGGSIFRTVRYTASDDITLGGRRQNDESGEESTERQFEYRLKLSENTGNDFLGASAGLDVSTYAIQHRNREDGTAEWINSAGE